MRETVVPDPVPCPCCGVPSREVRRPVDGRRPTNCERCTDHPNAGFMQRDKEHRQAWAEYHAGVVTAMQGRIDALGKALDDTQIETVRAEAFSQRNAAYRARGRAMRVLVRVDELHHETRLGSRSCTCGSPLASCKTASAVGAIFSELQRWEQDQIERARRGDYHELPPDHPVGKQYAETYWPRD